MEDPKRILSLSKLLHERTRLGIMTVLTSKTEEFEFSELLELLKLTKGNFAVHIGKLEQAGYVEVIKKFVGKMPRTSYKATPLGRKDFSDYLKVLDKVIKKALKNI